jgi:membrane-bound lytic murein transglycosylase D
VLPSVENQPYFVAVPKSQDIDVTLAARLANIPLDEFQALNPGFKRGIIPARERRQILLPVGQVDVFLANLDAYEGPLVTTPAIAMAEAAPTRTAAPTRARDNVRGRRAGSPAAVGTRAYRVRSGDTLYTIAAKNRTTVKTLLTLNRLKHSRITVGQTLRVPSSGQG